MKYTGYIKIMKQFRNVSWKMIRGVLIIGLCFIILFPLITKVSSSFMTEEDVLDRTVKWIPKQISFINYYRTFAAMNYPISFLNSFMLAATVSLMHLLSCAVVGYGLARFDFKGSSLIFMLAIFTLLVPPQVIMVPIYLNFRYFNFFGLLGESSLNLINSYWPFILTGITATGMRNGLYIFIFRQFFKGMPQGLEEAAKVDGAGPLKTFIKVMAPGAIPAMLIVFLFSFVWQWNDTFYLNLYVGNGEFLPFNLQNAGTQYNQIHQQIYGNEISGFTYSIINNTGMILFITPLLLLYGFLQRYFIESIERTGLVG